MKANTRFEIEARAFNIMTGHMAPGKDAPAAAGDDDYEERQRAWIEWKQTHSTCINSMILAFENQLEYMDLNL